MENDSPKKLKELRDRAEQLLSESPKGFKDIPAEDIQNLIHELQVHQIELEMQNEELRSTQAELEESRNRYVDLYDFAPVGYVTVDQNLLVIEANLTGADLLGIERSRLINKGLSHYIAEDYQHKYYSTVRQGFETRERQTCQLKLMKKNGTEFYAQLECIAVQDAEGNFNQLRIAITDITQIKRAEGALRESEEKYRSLLNDVVDQLEVGLFILDSDFRVVWVNRALERYFGFQGEEILGKHKRPLIQERIKYAFEDPEVFAGKVLATYDNNTYVENFQCHILPDDEREERWLEHWSRPIGSGLYAGGRAELYYNITDRVRAEEEKTNLEFRIQQAQKMEAIGILAGGIAHEFNNALSGITGNIDLLQMELSGNEVIGKRIEPMKASAKRMANLTSQLLAYARGGKYQAKNISLNDFVAETLPIIKHTIDPDIVFETVFFKDSVHLNGDLTQLQMILFVILTNASEAIEGKGQILITTGKEEIDEEFVKHHPSLKPGPYVCLTVEDNGTGMDRETKSRIFEPFFTTKFQGRGLGMASAYGIVKSHDGWISVYSEVGIGTVVRIYLPAVHVQVKGVKKPEIEPAKAGGTILVIEDEAVVLDVSRAMLEKLGYRVLEAKTGRDAIDIVKTFDGDIDLALLDIKLPDAEGGRIYPVIKEARPNLKVIICSGYSIHGPAQEILDAGAQGFIQKPFSFSTLSEKLKEVWETE